MRLFQSRGQGFETPSPLTKKLFQSFDLRATICFMTQPEQPRNLGTLYTGGETPIILHKIKGVDGRKFAEEPFSDGACFIGENTRFSLLGLLNIVENHDGTIQAVPSLGSAVKHPYRKAEEVAKNVFSLFKDVEGGMLTQASDWVQRSFSNQPQADNLRDAATIGMGVVLQAFHIEMGPELIDRVKKLDPQILASVFKNGISVTENKTIFGRIKNTQIPEFQVNLNEVISSLGHYVTHNNSMVVGAVEMYRVIDTLWDFLKKE